MDCGDIVFLKDEYFKRFPYQFLMENRPEKDGQKHRRPYIITKIDNQNPNIYWAVPISSQIKKFQNKYDFTIKKYHKCNTIRFGYLNNKKNAFLLQNLCPITDNYIDEPYKNRYGDQIHIDRKLLNNLCYNTNKLLEMEMHNVVILYSDIFSMRRELEKELLAGQSIKKENINTQQNNSIQAFCEKWLQEQGQNLSTPFTESTVVNEEIES